MCASGPTCCSGTLPCDSRPALPTPPTAAAGSPATGTPAAAAGSLATGTPAAAARSPATGTPAAPPGPSTAAGRGAGGCAWRCAVARTSAARRSSSDPLRRPRTTGGDGGEARGECAPPLPPAPPSLLPLLPLPRRPASSSELRSIPPLPMPPMPVGSASAALVPPEAAQTAWCLWAESGEGTVHGRGGGETGAVRRLE